MFNLLPLQAGAAPHSLAEPASGSAMAKQVQTDAGGATSCEHCVLGPSSQVGLARGS